MNIRTIVFSIILLIVFTRIMINIFTDEDSYDWGEPDYTIPNSFGKIGCIITIVILNTAAALSILIGFLDAIIAGFLLSEIGITLTIVITAVISVAIDCILYLIIGLYRIPTNFIKKICFVIIFVISLIVWGRYFYNYFNNFENTTKTVVTSKEERQLVDFDNIPVQNVSGKINGEFFSVSGEISTTDKLPYWYVEENGDVKYDSVETQDSKIVFTSENEKPYLEIVSYQTQNKMINHNNGKEDTVTEKENVEYIFHLPEEIFKQYSLKGG